MPNALQCPACEGQLGGAGSQVSCHSCGKVFLLGGRPNSKLGALVVGVGIGLVLGFIGAYELQRFVFDAAASKTTITVPEQVPAD